MVCRFPARWVLLSLSLGLTATAPLAAQVPLHQRIDEAIRQRYPGPFAQPATDADFLRRITLDLTGTLPSAQEVRQFLADPAPDKRARRIDRLIGGPDFPRRMQEAFNVMFEERRDTKDISQAAWQEYLLKSFAANKPWDQLVGEILNADPANENLKPAAKFYLDRKGDAHLITRDIGRLFLGRDIECSNCHDHPTVKDYTQADYYGLYAFVNRSFVFRKKKGAEVVFAEKAQPGKVDFESVFTMKKMQTGPRLPGGQEVVEPTFAKGQEYVDPPNPKAGKPGTPKYRPRAVLAEKVTEATPQAPFVRNSANRLWFLMMGRGVVHPLDMTHSGNPPYNPKLLDVLAQGLLECKFDVRVFLREIALSLAYQRSSVLPDGKEDVPEGSFAVAKLRPLSPEQLLYGVARATGAWDKFFEGAEKKLKAGDPQPLEARRQDPFWRAKVIQGAFAANLRDAVAAFGSRPGEAETAFQPSLAGALYLANDRLILAWLMPRDNNLAARLEGMVKDEAIADELYLTILTRPASAEERAEVARHLRAGSGERAAALRELAWALLASTEFRMNH